MTTSPKPAHAPGDVTCKTCGNTWAWHQQHPEVRHPFNDGSQPFKDTFGRRDRRVEDIVQQTPQADLRVNWPHDPVLRQALIDLGIITPQNLRDAEDKIRAVTAAFIGGNNGEGEVQVRPST